MRLRSAMACVPILVLVLGLGAARAAADTMTFDTPFEGPVVNDCTGETVVMSGTAHNKVTNNSSTSGIKSQIEYNLTGVQGTTATGVRYVMNSQTSDIEHADFDPSSNAQITMEQTINMIRQGETGTLLTTTGDDFQLHVIEHLTMNANGVPTSAKDDLNATCR
jgi:hypothetical protein